MGVCLVKLTERGSGGELEDVYVNPSAVIKVRSRRDGASVRIVGEEDVVIWVTESAEEVVAKLASADDGST